MPVAAGAAGMGDPVASNAAVAAPEEQNLGLGAVALNAGPGAVPVVEPVAGGHRGGSVHGAGSRLGAFEVMEETGVQREVEKSRGNLDAVYVSPPESYISPEVRKIIAQDRGAPRLAQNGRVLVDRRGDAGRQIYTEHPAAAREAPGGVYQRPRSEQPRKSMRDRIFAP